MSFETFVSKFKPPLTQEQVNEIAAEHSRLLKEATPAKTTKAK